MEKPPVKGWNYAPSVPIQVSPIFTWPMKPYEMVKWVWHFVLFIGFNRH